ncbi:molecular chaperone DnaJ [Iodidimonas muriae]|uniref:Molecular chaperone DnaJ n=1 Tax=Iodidimonas muriae TaxID=261467 RepID=A0ABQ2LB10_9PROT|nr:DnaJ C-terminal domain-containing protein [Iodidimonas muriae]GER08041.1 molecular chaperone DnaJ [Kordiimonadales bacterium JCM 17843]GGO09058.1 molecular chaperone DnaJ [Iodidimonas muriae]
MKDLYSILGVTKGADDAEIKRAYRKLAKELHPDRNKGNEKIVERFKEVSSAYGILGDKDKRARYDRGEIDENGTERAPYGAGGPGGAGGFSGFRRGGHPGGADFGDAEDVFADLFGFGRSRKPRTQRGQNVVYQLKVAFLDAVLGATRRVTLSNGKTLNVKIPAGVRDGQQIRLSGQGEPGFNGGPAGDALVKVEVEDHPYFTRDGHDILLDLPITLDEAVLGARISVPTTTGTVTLSVPKGASSGKRLRLKGKGISAGGKVGDQYVTLKIVLPKTVDSDLEKAIGKWAKSHPYTVRDHLET